MESYPSSTLTDHPLSAHAQTIMAALRAQYAGRVDGNRSIDSFKEGLRQPQNIYSKTSELPTKTNILHKEKERGFFCHSPKTELHGQPGIQLFQSGDNTFTQWGEDEASDWRLIDHWDDGGLLTLNAGNNVTVLGSPEPCSRKGSTSWGNQNARPDVIAFPQALIEISGRKGKIQQLCPNKDISSADMMPWSFGHLQIPTVTCSKQFEQEDRGQESETEKGNGGGGAEEIELFEERLKAAEEVMAMSAQEEQRNLGTSAKIQINALWSEGLHKDSSDKVLVCGNGHKEFLHKPQYCNNLKDFTERSLSKREFLNSPIFADPCGADQTVSGKPCFSSRNHLQTPSSGMLGVPSMSYASFKARGFDQETTVRNDGSVDRVTEERQSRLGKRASAKVTDWRNIQMPSEDSSTEQEHRAPPVGTQAHHNHQVLSKVTTGRCITDGLTKIVLLPKRPGKWEPPRQVQGHSRITLSQELYPKQIPTTSELASSSSSSEVQVCHGTEQTVSTRQPLNSAKYVQSREKRPMESTAPQREQKKQEHSSEMHSNIPKPSKQRCFAKEVKDQLNLDGTRKVEVSSATSKLTVALTSDPRVCDAKCLSEEERMCVLDEAGRARALVATMVYLDGTTQLDPEQKSTPAVCGFLVLLKKNQDSVSLVENGAAEERLLFLRLEHRPAWAQQHPPDSQDLFTREMVLKMVCGAQSLVCYKAKDLLRTALTHFSKDLSWKQVNSCQALDPQIAAWLLDPAESASCFQDLLNKHCAHLATHTPQPALRKVTQVISSLSHLHRLMEKLQNKLQMQGLWQLYFCMEMKMIPLLSAMESHKIYVDKKALKKTSEMLGTKIKQLEQEAHQAAGQKFLVSSSAQLRQVLFEKLHLHKHCGNKNLPKTMLKQQSTSEAVLLQLQDLHPLPRIILEYRQVHKIKSTFVDGILSCMTKMFISSTWNQTSAVTGRLSAKHPNFQALPKQPVKITKKQCVQGKESELVTVHPRAMFIPQEGWVFLSADFCQVELRLLAHLSSDPELLRTFQNPEADVFTMLASQWKGVPEDCISSEDREHAKRVVYSVVYGAGRERLSGILGVSAEEASRFQDSFLQTYREVQGFIQRTVQHCHKYGYVKSIMGRRRSLPHIHSADWGTRTQAERQAVNFVVQGSAADLCKMAMIQICSCVSSSPTLTARLVAQIHDELLFEVENTQVEDFAELVKKTMESLQYIDCLGVSLAVPLKVSVSKGQSWGSMCELNFPQAATHTSPGTP